MSISTLRSLIRNLANSEEWDIVCGHCKWCPHLFRTRFLSPNGEKSQQYFSVFNLPKSFAPLKSATWLKVKPSFWYSLQSSILQFVFAVWISLKRWCSYFSNQTYTKCSTWPLNSQNMRRSIVKALVHCSREITFTIHFFPLPNESYCVRLITINFMVPILRKCFTL